MSRNFSIIILINSKNGTTSQNIQYLCGRSHITTCLAPCDGVKDGMCFAKTVVEGMPSEDGNHKNDKVEAICIMYKTFVNDIMLFENQNKAIMQETWDKWTKSYIDFINENNGNDITLTLET